MTGRIFATIAPTWLQDPGGLASTTEYSIAFSVSVDQFLTEVAWYRSATGTQNLPSHLRVWDTTTAGTIYEVPIIPDSGAVGWQVHVPGVQVPLVAGRQYRVAATWNAGNRETYANSGSGSPGSPITLPGTYRYYNLGLGYPNSQPYGTTWVGVDVAVDNDPPAGTLPPDVPTSVDAALAGWLITTGDNTHQDDGLPWRTDANLTIVKGEAEGASGFAAIKAVADAVATSVGSGIGTAVSALTTAVGTANTALVHQATTWSDALAATLQAMSDDFASFGASKSAQGGGVTGAGSFPSGVGTLVWTMLDETDFAGEIAWTQPADVYVLSITTPPHGFPINLTDGVHTIFRAGWWCPLNGSFGRQRRFIDFEDNHLEVGAERMPGVLISLQPGGEGHLEAWALT